MAFEKIQREIKDESPEFTLKMQSTCGVTSSIRCRAQHFKIEKISCDRTLRKYMLSTFFINLNLCCNLEYCVLRFIGSDSLDKYPSLPFIRPSAKRQNAALRLYHSPRFWGISGNDTVDSQLVSDVLQGLDVYFLVTLHFWNVFTLI